MKMSGPDKYDWLKRTTTFSRIVNPELHAKPNLTVGAIGTGVFVFVIGNLLYQRHVYIQKQTESQNPKLELVIKENES